MIISLFLIAAVSFTVALVSTPLTIKLAKRLNLVDDERRQHPARVHQGVVPRAGGLALYLAIIVSAFLFIDLTRAMWGILTGTTVLLIVGLADDVKDINPYLRFLTNVAVALFVVAGGISIPFISNPLTAGVIHLDSWQISFNLLGSHLILSLANLVAILWIVWTMNIVGWSSGVDGQLPGFVVIAALILGGLSLRFLPQDPAQFIVIKLAMATAGAYLGFLPWNFYPQKIMPGYSGKTLAGFMLATLAILAQAKVGTAILVLGVPMTDAFYTLIRRVAGRHSPVWPDRGHLHHRLLDLGWGKRRIAIFYWIISALLGLVALTVTARMKLFVVFALAVWIGGLIIWAHLFRMFRG